MAAAATGPGSVAAWDLPTRLFHWALVVLVVCAWVSYAYAEDLGDVTLIWHRWNGLFILILIVWRVLWGFAGSSTSRFASFAMRPGAVMSYARGLVRDPPIRYLGHNPLGVWMVLALLAALTAQGALGLFAIDDNDLTGGPLYRLVSAEANKAATRWHAWSFYSVLLLLVAVHVAANVLYALVKKEPLIRAMVTGAKPECAYADQRAARIVPRPLLRAAGLLALSAAIVLGGIAAAGGRLPVT